MVTLKEAIPFLLQADDPGSGKEQRQSFRALTAPAMFILLGLVLGILGAVLVIMIRRGEASRVSALFFLIPPTAAVFAKIVESVSKSPLTAAGPACDGVAVGLAPKPLNLLQRVPQPPIEPPIGGRAAGREHKFRTSIRLAIGRDSGLGYQLAAIDPNIECHLRKGAHATDS